MTNKDTTPTSGTADLPEALHRSTAADGKTELFNLPGYPLMVRAVDFNRLHTESEMRRTALLDEMQKAALAAGQATAAQPVVPAEWPTNEMIDAGRKAAASQGRLLGSGQSLWHVFRAMLAAAPAQPVAQQGVAYAALPEPYCNAHDDADACYPDMFSEQQMRAFADATHALRASRGQAPAGAGEVRRAELVPGVMHCAKCKFQLNRVTLCVSDGNAYAGNNKTEPCPNGCGPLWPVTWEQEAKNCWKALEEMHERLMAAAAPQPSPTAQSADSVPAVSDLPPLPAPDLRDVGTKPQEIKEFLKGYATEYARTAIAARAPADSVQEDAMRYRWLRATTNYVTSNGERIDVRNMPEKWDAAIDAAIAAQGGK